MPRRKKKASELTTEEAMRRVFPARVVAEAKKAAQQSQKKSTRS